MNQETLSQLIQECQDTISRLRDFRDEFNRDEKSIQQAVGHSLSKERLVDVEHLHNQFDIQLKNIHDLKHGYEALQRQLSPDADDTILKDKKDKLRDDFQALEQTLIGLRGEFENFVTKVNA
ncbi:MAG: hypothetical protein RLZZ46_141 [Bacteroidota bacterium]|jgi:prefoldin subunit 5